MWLIIMAQNLRVANWRTKILVLYRLTEIAYLNYSAQSQYSVERHELPYKELPLGVSRHTMSHLWGSGKEKITSIFMRQHLHDSVRKASDVRPPPQLRVNI